MSAIRIGIVGYGRMGRLRASVLRDLPSYRLVGIAEPRGEALADVECPTYDDYRPLVRRSDVDAVVVCTPNFLNAEVTIAALEHGKHVFCEKPPARSTEEMRRVVACEARSGGLKLKFGFNHRYHDAVREAKALVESGRLGRVLWLRGVYGKSGGDGFESNWRNRRELSGGGILLDQGIHMLDLFRCFAGEFDEVKSMIAKSFWDIDVEDNAFVLLRNERGQVAMLHSSATHWKHHFGLDIFLSDGYVQINGILTQSRSYGRETLVTASRGFSSAQARFGYGSPREEITYFDQDESWRRELEDFAEAILEDRPVAIGGSADAMRTLDLVERIYRADETWEPHRRAVTTDRGESR